MARVYTADWRIEKVFHRLCGSRRGTTVDQTDVTGADAAHGDTVGAAKVSQMFTRSLAGVGRVRFH